jgi:hypothetical protein
MAANGNILAAFRHLTGRLWLLGWQQMAADWQFNGNKWQQMAAGSADGFRGGAGRVVGASNYNKQ